jgi:serine/threonine protein kinase
LFGAFNQNCNRKCANKRKSANEHYLKFERYELAAVDTKNIHQSQNMSKRFGKYTKHGNSDAGYGAFGKVWFYRNFGPEGDFGNIVYAAKIVPLEKWNDREAEILRMCQHENIVRYFDFVRGEDEVMVVTELLQSSLYGALLSKKRSLFTVAPSITRAGDLRVNQTAFYPPLGEHEMLSIVANCFDGLSYLHRNDVSHRDLSSPNILLQVTTTLESKRTIVAKLADFGMSTIAPRDKNHTTGLQNAFYSAPEAQAHQPQYDGFSVDVYSLGVVIFECFMQQLGNSRTVNQCRTNRTSFGAIALDCAFYVGASKFRAYQELLKLMVHSDPKKRPSVDDAFIAWKQCSVFDVREAVPRTPLPGYAQHLPAIVTAPCTASDTASSYTPFDGVALFTTTACTTSPIPDACFVPIDRAAPNTRHVSPVLNDGAASRTSDDSSMDVEETEVEIYSLLKAKCPFRSDDEIRAFMTR